MRIYHYLGEGFSGAVLSDFSPVEFTLWMIRNWGHTAITYVIDVDSATAQRWQADGRKTILRRNG
jgi:hypothetical protein